MRLTAWRYALGVFGVLTAAYFVVPGTVTTTVIYSVVGALCVACIALGIVLNRPVKRRAWWAMAIANALFVLGDALLAYYQLVLHQDAPFPSVSDALYLSGYPFLVLAVAVMFRAEGGSSREDRTDAAIVTVGALALLWQLLMGNYAHDSSLSTVARLVTMAYPIMDIGVLYIVLHALFATRTRQLSHLLIAAGVGAMLIADLGYDLMVLHGSYQDGSAIDAGWLISYAALGVAALHPSAGRTTPPARRGEVRTRLPFVALAGLITPCIAMIAGWWHFAIDLPVLGGLAILLFVLVIARVRWLMLRLTGQAEALTEQSRKLAEALEGQRLLQEDLRHQAFHDSLTGLANRALLQNRIEHALRAAARSSGEVAVLFCDLDGFKTVNDGIGHHVGDEVLAVVARRLESVVRASDTVARLGGDEFALLLDCVDDPDVALITAERVLAVVRQPIEWAGQQLRVSMSIGISFSAAGKQMDALLSEADAAMYAAKAAGKDRVACFEEEMRASVIKRMELRNSFEGALERGEFYLLYQPHVSLTDGAVEGFEALARWRHPVYGEISPMEFIPLAEESGFIVPFGRWVLETACATASGWRSVGDRSLTVAVNVSARQLQSEQFLTDVAAALAYTGLAPERLILEITESLLMTDPAETTLILSRLKAMGLRVAIDDFGTGYSSLSYLRQFPIDILKIDKSFVDPLIDPANQGEAFVGTIIGLAHALGLTTVAEGIEDRTQKRALAELGCDSGQGYLLSRPVTDVAASELIHAAGLIPDTAVV